MQEDVSQQKIIVDIFYKNIYRSTSHVIKSSLTLIQIRIVMLFILLLAIYLCGTNSKMYQQYLFQGIVYNVFFLLLIKIFYDYYFLDVKLVMAIAEQTRHCRQFGYLKSHEIIIENGIFFESSQALEYEIDQQTKLSVSKTFYDWSLAERGLQIGQQSRKDRENNSSDFVMDQLEKRCKLLHACNILLTVCSLFHLNAGGSIKMHEPLSFLEYDALWAYLFLEIVLRVHMYIKIFWMTLTPLLQLLTKLIKFVKLCIKGKKLKIFPMKVDELTLSTIKQRSCSVCCMDIVMNQQILILPCQHSFHDECMRKWANIRKTCPICRYQLEEQI